MNRTPVRSATALLAGAVVVLARPDGSAWSAAVAGLRGTGPTPSLDGFVALVAGATLWGLALWVLLALGAGRLAAAPGLVGAVGRAAVRLTVPRALRGIVVRGVVSGGVAGGLLLGPAAVAVAVPVWPTGPAASASVGTPGPAWPTSPAGPTTPAPATPTASSPVPTPPAASTDPGPTSTGPTSTGPAGPSPTTPTTPTGPTGPAVGATDVVVVPGDSLWSIAAADLRRHGTPATDTAVAAAWPAWFAVNRAVVGADPGLLHPGTHLTAPPVTPTPNPTDGSTP